MRPIQILAGIMAMALIPARFSFAQSVPEYPTKTVRVIVSSAPGGGSDIQVRMFAQKVSESLKHPFVVDNRPGAADVAATKLAAQSQPDGYTLIAVSPTFAFGSELVPGRPYDPIKDFAPISLVAKAPYLLLVHPSLPVRSVKELIALAKSKPGALDMGATTGNTPHLASIYFTSLAGIKVTFIPYKGIAQVMVDTMAGRVHMFFGTVLATLPQVKSGKLTAVAVSTAERFPALPELPTIAESGVRGYDASTWHGWLAPAGTAAPIVRRLSAELARAVRSPDVAKELEKLGGAPIGSTPEQFQQLIAEEVPRWQKIVKDTGLRVE